jgi:Flp pilus assembly pilin Flp
MEQNRLHSESGQASVETVLIIAAIALGCLVTAIFLSSSIRGIFGSISDPSGPPPSAPFVPPAVEVVPVTIEDCLNGGWRNYPQFTNQGQCVHFVQGAG